MEVRDGRENRSKPIRYKWDQRVWIREYVNDLVARGIVSKSEGGSEFAHAVVLVPEAQSGQDYRFCINYKHVNSRTVPDNFPMPNVDDTLERLSKAKFYTCIDLKAGFHNVLISPESRPYTTFVTQDGCYHWNRLAFGLMNAPAFFQKVVQETLGELDKSAVIYLDDIVVFGESREEVWSKTVEVLERLV